MAEHHINLTMKSTSGTIHERFSDENRAAKVLEVAIKKIPLDPSPSRPYVLRLERTGHTLDLHEKLRDQDVRDGDTILVQASQPVDG